MANENSIRQEFDEAYNQAAMVWSEWFTQAHRDLKFYLGDQWSAEDKEYLRQEGRNAFVFNKIKRAVELVDGYQRKNVLTLRIQPVEGADDPQTAMMQAKTASQLSEVALWLMQYEGGYNILNECFSGALKTGLNFLRLYLDYSDDLLSGDIKFMRAAYNQIMVDPYFTHRDFSDCSYILFREFITKEEGQVLFPKQAVEIGKMTPLDSDSKFVYLKAEKDLMGSPKLRFDEFFKRTTKQALTVIDKKTGQYAEWEGNKKDLNAALQGSGDRFEIINRYKPTVEHTIWVNDELMYNGPEAFGLDDFPYIPIFANFEPEFDDMTLKLQSYIRCMIDPQQEINKRRSKIIDIMDSQIQTGWTAKEGSVVDAEALYGTGQGKVVWTKKDAQPGDVVKIPPGDVPPGLFQIIQVLDKDIMEIPGGNAEMFGAPEHDNMEISGILSKLRTGAGLTILQPIFDNLRYAKKILGQKLVVLIQKNYSPQKVKKIIKEEPTPEFYSKEFGKYDCLPTEGILTDTQKQMYFTQLLFLKERFPDCPIPWDVILEAAPMENKDKVLEQIRAQQQKQAQVQQMQLAMQMVEMKLRNAQLGTEIASAQEKIAKSQMNRATAIDERMQSVKKMQQMDVQELKEVVNVMGMLEQWLQTTETGNVGQEEATGEGGSPQSAGQMNPLEGTGRMNPLEGTGRINPLEGTGQMNLLGGAGMSGTLSELLNQGRQDVGSGKFRLEGAPMLAGSQIPIKEPIQTVPVPRTVTYKKRVKRTRR